MKILLFANTDWYLYNFRLPLARALCAQGHEVLLLSPEGEYGKRLREQGLRWEPFPLARRGTNPLAELAAIWKLRACYHRERPDIVHHFTIKCVLYGSLAAHLAGVKGVVNAITGMGYVFVNRGLRARLLRLIVPPFFRLALQKTQVIFQNPDDQAAFQEMGLVQTGQSCLVRGSGVAMERYHPQPEPEGTALVVLAGRLLWDKGVGEFVEAARLLRAEGILARFALVGDGDPSNPASVPNEQLRAWQKEGVVEWWGWREDMCAVFTQANVICLPSYREGVPKSLLEASALQRAVVTTDVPGCREVVIPGETGLMVPARDAKALAAALKQLLQEAELRKRMGIRGRTFVEENFSARRIIGETLAVYQKALQERAKT